MPDMDGIRLAAELKSRTQGNPVVIMISAAELSEVIEEAKNAGVDKFLAKPLFPSSIADIISESLAQGQRQQVKAEQAKISSLFEGRHILLAEDVEINREIVLTLLESSGLEIDCAENGVEAVRMFTEAPHKYNMIFMDVQMPEMDGYEATRQIRAIEAKERGKTTSMEFPKETPQLLSERPQSVPIIAMTANVFREDIEQCLEAGMTSHIGKPLDMDELFRTLRQYLMPR
jgi:CheY-like chemotaxis protein